jgi:hypothetical protein
MAAPPLTHHEILRLAEPFARAGRHVDLAASDRLARRLVFKPIVHAATAEVPAEIREILELECHGSGSFDLTRVLMLGDGLRSTLQASGRDAVDLLARVAAIEPQYQFRCGARYAIARTYTLQDGPDGGLRLESAIIRLDGLRVTFSVSTVRGVATEITLVPAFGNALQLPDDLLAVLGWNWTRLVRDRDGWNTRLRLRGGVARRTRTAEAALDRLAAHLAGTLAEPPHRFHEQWAPARWGVVFRRAIPLLTFAALLVAVAFGPRLAFAQNPGGYVMFFHAPTLVLALSFCLQELPQFELPPLPRRNDAANWQPSQAQT